MATILIVEDHAMSRELLNTLLENMGHRVLEAADGMVALELARSEHPDLIISDILLPVIDGMEFVRQLRAERALEDTPIIFYTAIYRLPEALRLGVTHGTCRVIPKPSDPFIILQTVHDVLGISPAGVAPQPVTELPRSVLKKSTFFQSFGLQLAMLMDLNYSMVAQQNPEQLLNTVSRAVREILNCRHSFLAIQENDGRTRYFFGCTENEPTHTCPADLLPPPGILERVVAGRAPVRLRLTPCASATDMFHCLPPFETLLVVPFASPSRVYGWICLRDKQDAAPFSDRDEEMAMTLGTQAALAYENILLIEQLRKSEEYLEVLVAKRTAELEQANIELLKVQKLQSLGVLAGGIAHDFNNALTVIINLIQLAKIKSNPEDIAPRYLDWAEKACYDAVSLTRQLLTFAKGGSPVKKAAVLSDLLWDTVEFTLRGSKVKCEFSFTPDLFVVDIDQGQINQVVSNLVINADQAMPEGGIVRVSAENVVVSKSETLPLRDGRYVRLSVIDQGVGIPQEDLHRIFDPYFTTKETGSGLGLATAYSIVKKHDGHITVESEIGLGTSFHVYLPASDKKPDTEKDKQEIRVSSGRVLLIEDQESIAISLAELLGMNGYMVDYVRDGAAGLKLYKNAMKNGLKYNAVIMDLTIPGGMGGKEAIKRFQEMDPGVMAIVASGYSNDQVMSNYREYGFSGAVSKPYHIEDLMRELQRVRIEPELTGI